jgi:hypothetical protein
MESRVTNHIDKALGLPMEIILTRLRTCTLPESKVQINLASFCRF